MHCWRQIDDGIARVWAQKKWKRWKYSANDEKSIPHLSIQRSIQSYIFNEVTLNVSESIVSENCANFVHWFSLFHSLIQRIWPTQPTNATRIWKTIKSKIVKPTNMRDNSTEQPKKIRSNWINILSYKLHHSIGYR